MKRKRFTPPELSEIGSLSSLTGMDGIGHNGGAISGASPP